jgi:hypothetical protein
MDSELRLYDVIVGGHKTQMRLNDVDAVAMGAVLAESAPARASSSRVTAPDPAGKSRLVTSNKMRGTDPDRERAL